MGGKYFWVVDFLASKDGQLHPIVVGGRCFQSEIRAQQFIDNSNMSPKAEIIPLGTSNTSKASQMIKAILIERYHNVSKGMTKAVHRIPSEGQLSV